MAFHGVALHAGDLIPPITPEELAMKSEPLAPGAPAIILFRLVQRDDNGRTSHEDNFVRIKILNEEGLKYANREIPFVKGRDNVVNVKAHTIRPDGSVVNYDGKLTEQTIVKSRGLKYLAKTLALPDVHPGSIIEYSYTYDLTEHLIYDSHWILSEDLFTRRAIFTLKPYNGRFNVRWSWQGLPPGTEPPKEGPDHIIRMEARNVPAFQTEDFMPPANELKSRVDFTYSDNYGDANPATFWKNVGKARYADLEHFIDKRKAMQQAVSQIVSPQDSLEEKAKKIYYRVQQMRNTSYEPSKTEQEEKREEAKKLVNVEEVWSRGFGDGVQLTWLYLALVRAAGLEADGVWVSGRNDYFFRPDVQVDSARLNANVVQLRIEGKEIYCDPGGKFTPYGLLPWYETGVSGLRLDKDGGTWIKTPLPPASASVVERKADLTLTDSGDLEGQLTITYTGLEAESHRHEERFEDEAGRRKYLEEIVKRLIPTASEPTLTNQPDWNGSASPLVAEFTLKVPGWASQTGRRVMLPVGLFSAPEKHLFDHADRVYPVYMNYPFQQKEDIAITMASGWQIGTLPPEHKQDGHIITYSLTVAKDKSTLRLNRTISVDFLLLDNKYYTALRTFFQGVKTSDDQQIVLQPAATTAGN
jgi:hypothetical protein